MAQHQETKSYTLDAMCFINAVNQAGSSYEALRVIFNAANTGKITLTVSIQTLHELERKPDAALELARTLDLLPHWPIGSWDEQIGPWEDQTGSWEDAKRNNEKQVVLKTLANAGTSIRDRGAFMDAFCNAQDGFITSDKAFIKSGPSARINKNFLTKVLTPEELANAIAAKSL
jgi:hypothetical protein